ncbi:MAG: leucine-rich repeat domain-containing protein [Bacteroidales bacterium]|nr:leucine-rich repeat domain-containing protein [Bacteroidales bacterium]
MAKYEIKDGVGIIPEGTNIIAPWAFEDCTELTSVTIPDSVTEIGNNAFQGCTSLKSITIPDSVTKIGMYAFSGSGLINIVIPKSVKSIDTYAFINCNDCVSISVMGPVNSLQYNVFASCIKLETITFGTGIKKIDPEILNVYEKVGTNGIKKIYDFPPTLKAIYVPAKKTDYYQQRLPQFLHSLIVEKEPEKESNHKKMETTTKTCGEKKNVMPSTGKYYLTLEGTYLHLSSIKLSAATDEKIELLIDNKNELLDKFKKMVSLDDVVQNVPKALQDLLADGDVLREGSFLIDADQNVKVKLFSAPADIDDEKFENEVPDIDGNALKTIQFAKIPTAKYEWGYESEEPDRENNEQEEYEANKLAASITGLGAINHLLKDYNFQPDWHIISMQTWKAVDSPTTFLITTNEQFDIKRLRLIIVSVEELTNFNCWTLVAGATYDNKLLPMVNGTPTKWSRPETYIVKISEDCAYNEKAFDVNNEEWNK